MRKLIAAAVLVCVLAPPPAAAEVHEVDLFDFTDDVIDDLIEFDAGAVLTGITAVKLVLRGTWTPSFWGCIRDAWYAEAYGDDAIFGGMRDEEGGFANAFLFPSRSFDAEVAFTLYGYTDWSSLEDGIAIIDLNYGAGEPRDRVDRGYHCYLVREGSVAFEEATLRIEAESIVGAEIACWSTIKAAYR